MIPLTLDQGLTQLGISPTSRQREQLRTYANLLQKWNKAYNLIGKSTESEIDFRHLLDSAQLAPLVSHETDLVDIGSGAGLPAIVLAILTDVKVTACEPLRKRCQFMAEVRRQAGLHDNLVIENKKAEELAAEKKTYGVVTARAVADIPALLDLGTPLLKSGGRFVLLKGGAVEKELNNPLLSLMTISLKSSITSLDGKIVEIKPA